MAKYSTQPAGGDGPGFWFRPKNGMQLLKLVGSEKRPVKLYKSEETRPGYILEFQIGPFNPVEGFKPDLTEEGEPVLYHYEAGDVLVGGSKPSNLFKVIQPLVGRDLVDGDDSDALIEEGMGNVIIANFGKSETGKDGALVAAMPFKAVN